MSSSGPRVKQKRRQFSLKEKVDILTELSNGKKQVDLCRERDIAPSTVATILKDRDKIMKLHRESQLAPSRKRLRLGDFQEVDDAVLTWFKDARQHDVPLSGPIIQEKARQFAFALDISGFDASAGWLYRFRQRNGIAWQVACGKEKAADTESAVTWRNDNFQEIVEAFSPDDVFNADETACFYQLLPDKTMNFKGEKCKGGKKSRLRVSVLFCCNSTGTEKLKPLVIGKSAKPRCLKNVVSLPCDYRANKKAWMTRELFTQWLLQLDDAMKKKGRKILLIVDNCSAHVVNVRLSNVKLEFLPPNCTSLLQPLDQGIIRCVKAEFRKRLVQRLLINIRLKLPTEVNIRQAAEMLTGSWWSVKASTISNCWRRAGLFKTSPVPQESEDREELNPELWDELTEKLPFDTAVTFDDYVDCDSAAATSAELTTEDIVNQVRGQEQCDDEDDAEDADTVSTHEEEATVSSSDALVSIEKIRLFLGRCEDVPDDVHKKVEDVESFVLQRLSSTRQKKITDFFKQ